MERFESTMDRGTRLLTAFVLLAVLAVMAMVVRAGISIGEARGSVVLGAVVALTPFTAVLLLAVAWRETPREITVDGAAVTILRRAGPIAFPLASIRAVRELGPGVTFRRQVGAGGFFGYTGTFQNAELGPVQMLATRSDGRVLLETATQRWVLTPDDPGRFVAAVERRMGR
jgi:hypothetical protein